MTELELENKFKQFSKDESRLEEIKIRSKVNLFMFVSTTVYVFTIPILSIFLTWASYTFVHIDYRDNLALLVGIIATIVSVMLIILFFTSIDGSGEWKTDLESFIEDSVKNSVEKKKLVKAIEERKEFFKLYELMKDESYRASYLEALKPDKTLMDKINKL